MRFVGWVVVGFGCSGPSSDDGATTRPPVTGPEPTVPFVVDDVIVSDESTSLLDPELDDASSRITWQEPSGAAVWVADVDPATGASVPDSATRVAVNVMAYEELHNGPEWMGMPSGSALVFTKYDGGVPWLVVAEETGPGTWTSTPLLVGRGGFGTADAPVPAVTFLDDAGEMNWSRTDLSDSATFMPRRGHYRPWFVGGTDWIVFTARPDGGGAWQVNRQDMIGKGIEPLTSCPLGCVHGNLAWSEELGDWLLVTVELDGEDEPARLLVFQEDGGAWPLVRTIEPPDRGALRFVLSPELFVFDGKVWNLFSLSETGSFADVPSELWLVGVEPGNDTVRLVSGDEPMVRKDPEYLVTDETVWVYYSEVRGDLRILHRCASGLTVR